MQNDALILRFLGGRCPHQTLLYKELERLSKSRPTLTLDLKKLNMEVIAPCLPAELIADLDSTVETVYGNQEGAPLIDEIDEIHGGKTWPYSKVIEDGYYGYSCLTVLKNGEIGFLYERVYDYSDWNKPLRWSG